MSFIAYQSVIMFRLKPSKQESSLFNNWGDLFLSDKNQTSTKEAKALSLMYKS